MEVRTGEHIFTSCRDCHRPLVMADLCPSCQRARDKHKALDLVRGVRLRLTPDSPEWCDLGLALTILEPL